MAATNKKIDLSEKILKASESGKEGMVSLLYELQISKVENLQKRVIRQFRAMSDDDEKYIYADRIVRAANLPMCLEFSRILTNCYDRKKYSAGLEERAREKADAMYDVFEEFLSYSDILQEKKREFEIKRAKIDSKKQSYRRH